MLKHVQLSPYRTRATDSPGPNSISSESTTIRRPVSTRFRRNSQEKQSPSSDAASTTSAEPPSSLLSSRSSSYCSLNETPVPHSFPTTTIKVYAKCLRSDIEYKTLGITYQTTCREVVTTLLKKFRMRHRDPNLFYLTMEVTVRTAGIRTILPLDEEARPAALQSCHPRGDSRFALQTRKGGLVKIYDGDVVPGSLYKSLLVSERTTADEIIQILLDCYNSHERVERFSLYEVCEEQEYRRKLHPDDCPLQVQRTWTGDVGFHFRIGKNARYGRTKRAWSPTRVSRTTIFSESAKESSGSRFPSSGFFSDSDHGSVVECLSPNRLSCYSEYDNFFYI